MKNFFKIGFALLMVLAITLNPKESIAQVDFKSNIGTLVDSVENSTSIYMTTDSTALNNIGLAGNYSIEAVATKKSGTADVTIILERFIKNGWKAVDTVGVVTDVSGAQTFHLDITDKRSKMLRLNAVSGGGTQVVEIRGALLTFN